MWCLTTWFVPLQLLTPWGSLVIRNSLACLSWVKPICASLACSTPCVGCHSSIGGSIWSLLWPNDPRFKAFSTKTRPSKLGPSITAVASIGAFHLNTVDKKLGAGDPAGFPLVARHTKCINCFPMFGRFERVLGPLVQECCSLRIREVWSWHRNCSQFFCNFFTIFHNWVGPSLIAAIDCDCPNQGWFWVA